MGRKVRYCEQDVVIEQDISPAGMHVNRRSRLGLLLVLLSEMVARKSEKEKLFGKIYPALTLKLNRTGTPPLFRAKIERACPKSGICDIQPGFQRDGVLKLDWRLPI